MKRLIPFPIKLPLTIALFLTTAALSVSANIGCATTPDPAPRAAITVPERAAAAPIEAHAYVTQDYDMHTRLAPTTVCAQAEDRIYFDAGSNDVSANATSFLDVVVACLDSTKLQDKELLIIGYAQPEEHVNPSDLGLSRAHAVASYLHAKGLNTRRFEVRSAGTTHFYDDMPRHQGGRRVDLKIVDDADSAARDLMQF